MASSGYVPVDMQQSMGASSSGPMSSGGMHGASGNMGMPTPTVNPFSRHGSAEQVVRDSYMDMTPPVTTTRNTPRDSRTRSPRSTRNEESQPVGSFFRMNACEQTLREHNAELATQRLLILQLRETIQQMLVDKETTGQRLDQVFSLVDQKVSGVTGQPEVNPRCGARQARAPHDDHLSTCADGGVALGSVANGDCEHKGQSSHCT